MYYFLWDLPLLTFQKRVFMGIISLSPLIQHFDMSSNRVHLELVFEVCMELHTHK